MRTIIGCLLYIHQMYRPAERNPHVTRHARSFLPATRSGSGVSARIGVVLGQVGTPLSLDIREIRRYLGEFLADPRMIDLPRWVWWPVLHGVILRRRPQAVAQHYREIWTSDGSPLMVTSLAQQRGLAERLGPDYQVELGLAYSSPSLSTAMSQLAAGHLTNLVVLPLFPQFSTTTTASIYDAVLLDALGRTRGAWRSRRLTVSRSAPEKKYSPAIHCIPPYYDDPRYIALLADSITRQLADAPEPDHILVSYHGLPQRYVDEGDPYVEQCHETTRLLAESLGWPQGNFETAFQSRFGRAEWIKPYLQPRLGELHAQGITRPAIVAPGFTTDCLETLHELAIEGRELFVEGGGDPDKYRFISCLNDDPAWLDYLADLVRTAGGGFTRTTTAQDPTAASTINSRSSRGSQNHAQRRARYERGAAFRV